MVPTVPIGYGTARATFQLGNGKTKEKGKVEGGLAVQYQDEIPRTVCLRPQNSGTLQHPRLYLTKYSTTRQDEAIQETLTPTPWDPFNTGGLSFSCCESFTAVWTRWLTA